MDLLRPPRFEDPQLDQQAATLWMVALAGVATMVVQAISYALVPTMASSAPYLLPEGLLFAGAFFAIRRGHVRGPAWLLTVAFTLLVTAFVFWGGGLSYGFPALLGTVAILGTLVLGTRVGVALTAWAAVCTIAVLVVGSSEVLLVEGQAPDSARFTIQLVSVLLGGALVNFTVFRLFQALDAERTQATLLGAARRFNEAMVQTMVDGVVVTSPDGLVLQLNDAAVKLFGLAAPEEMLQRPLKDYIDVDALSRLKDTGTPGERAVGEATVRTGVPVRLARSRLRGEAGADVLVYVVADIRVQIEARRRSEEAAQSAAAANRAKSQFLANMSHELRTPLNAVIGYADMLLDDLEEPDLVADVRRIRQAGKHLLSLINDVLDMSKIEAGRMEVFVERIDLAQLVADVIEQIAPVGAKRGNHLTFHVDDPDLVVHTDGQKLRQILLNLLSNAVKFTEQGSVSVRVYEGDDRVRFEVTDTGIGIEPQLLEHLFEPFVQADDSTQRRYGGTGLGLALSRRFAELLGGTLKAQSASGVGSTFTLALPRGHGSVTVTPPVAIDSGTSPLVLCVDDDPATLDLFGRLFRRHGLRVALAGSGADALELARAHRPAVITLDVMMPEMDGWMLLRRLREDADLQSVPVVMVSMVDDGLTSALSLGAADYLVKPVDPVVMVSTIRRYLSEGSGRVLVVDDEPDMRDLLERLLTGEGWTTRVAGGSREALELLHAFRPELIVLDLMMPDLDGFGFIERIRADEEFRNVPILVHTAMDLTHEQYEMLSKKTEMVVPKAGNGLHSVLREVRRFADRH